VVSWAPALDPAKDEGFAVFRSLSAGGMYRQVGTLVRGSEYQDLEVVRGMQYWYKVLRLRKDLQITPQSAPSSGTLP
jgi:hypothetical protein